MTSLSIHRNHFELPVKSRWEDLWLLPGGLLALMIGWLIARSGLLAAVALIGLPVVVAVAVAIFFRPRLGFWGFIVYCFIMPGLGRHIPGQLGLAYDGLLVLIWLSVIFWRTDRFRWRHTNNDLVWFSVVWFALSVLELGNPARPDPQGWIQELRGVALYWILITPLVFFLLNKKQDLDTFLNIIILFSFLAAIYGGKQLILGVDGAEQAWLDSGPKRTHIVAGKLRVFSFYAEAAQFGASQGQLAIMCVILAIGPYGRKKKWWYCLSALVILYGMLISGTRGAMGALMGGGLVFLILSKQLRVMIGGFAVGALFVGFLKFTTIANSNAQIHRLRSSTNSDDASLQVRFTNQKTLAEYLKTRPFGTGVGTTGTWGVTFNRHIPIATIQPDSLFVKIWVMYGVVGLVFWLSVMLFILGKSIGIVWRTRDPVLRNQLTALTAGSFGALVCSYGNEVMNQMPTSMIVYVSWALIWLSPRWDTPPKKESTPVNPQPALWL